MTPISMERKIVSMNPLSRRADGRHLREFLRRVPLLGKPAGAAQGSLTPSHKKKLIY